jgi:hypothetical protein
MRCDVVWFGRILLLSLYFYQITQRHMPEHNSYLFFEVVPKFRISTVVLKEIHLDEYVDLSRHFKFYNILFPGNNACFVSEVLAISMLILLMV